MFVLVNFWRLLNRARQQIEEQMRWLQLHNHHGRKQPLFAYSLSLIFLDLLSLSVCESKNLRFIPATFFCCEMRATSVFLKKILLQVCSSLRCPQCQQEWNEQRPSEESRNRIIELCRQNVAEIFAYAALWNRQSMFIQ